MNKSYLLEEAIVFLCQHMPVYDAVKMPKPTLSHCLRVGFLLQKYNEPDYVCIAGFLHDLLEDTEVQPGKIESLFGRNVMDLVLCNTKNRTLPKEHITDDLLHRAAQNKKAFTVKVADTWDSFFWYTSTKNEKELQDYVLPQVAFLLIQIKKQKYTSPFFLDFIQAVS